MPRIIKKAEYSAEPIVVVKERRSRHFVPSYISDDAAEMSTVDRQGAGEGSTESPVDAAVEAERILADAHARAAELAREAMERGYADGKAEGLKVADEQTREHLERLAELAKRAVIERESMIRASEQELATLALEIASKVIKREIASDPSLVLSMVESAMEKVGTTESVRILVHPDDANLVRDKWSELKGAVAFGPNWEIFGDEGMERGGCIIETKSGLVDSRIEAQLAEIVSAFEAGQ